MWHSSMVAIICTVSTITVLRDKYVASTSCAVWPADSLHLHFCTVGNNNSGYGKIDIVDCQFQGARSAAIRLLEPSRELQPPTVGKPPELRGGPHHNLQVFRGSFSTQVRISGCEFVHCAQALVNWADWTHMEDCWVNSYTPYMPPRTAVLENHDRLFITRMLGVPGNLYKQCDPNDRTCPDLRWVDNFSYRTEGGQVIVRDSRFGALSPLVPAIACTLG